MVGSSGGTCEHGNRFLQGEAVNNVNSCLLFLAAYNNVEEKDSNQTDQSKSLCAPALHACMRSDYMSHSFYNLMISVIMCLKKLPKNFFILTKYISGDEIVRKRRTTRGQPRSKPSTGRGLLTPQVLQDIPRFALQLCLCLCWFVC